MAASADGDFSDDDVDEAEIDMLGEKEQARVRAMSAEELAERRQQQTELWMRVGRMWARGGDMRAAAVFRRLARRLEEAALRLADVLPPAAAVKSLQRAVPRYSGSAAVTRKMVAKLLLLNRSTDAVRCLTQFIALHRDNTAMRPAVEEFLFMRVAVCVQGGDEDGAETMFSTLTAEGVDTATNPAVFALDAAIKAMNGQMNMATELITNQAALNIIAGLPISLSLPLAEQLAAAGQAELSAKRCEALIQVNGDNAMLLSSYATHSRSLDPQDALVYFQSALQIDETNEQAVIGVASLLWPEGGQPDQCLNVLETFFRSLPENVAGTTSDALNTRSDVVPPNDKLRERDYLNRADMSPHLSGDRCRILLLYGRLCISKLRFRAAMSCMLPVIIAMLRGHDAEFGTTLYEPFPRRLWVYLGAAVGPPAFEVDTDTFVQCLHVLCIALCEMSLPGPAVRILERVMAQRPFGVTETPSLQSLYGHVLMRGMDSRNAASQLLAAASTPGAAIDVPLLERIYHTLVNPRKEITARVQEFFAGQNYDKLVAEYPHLKLLLDVFRAHALAAAGTKNETLAAVQAAIAEHGKRKERLLLLACTTVQVLASTSRTDGEAQRNELVLDVTAAIMEYRDVAFQEACSEPNPTHQLYDKMQCFYNVGRVFDQLGMPHISVPFYERVLAESADDADSETSASDADCVFVARLAAYNLQLIYRGSNSVALPNALIRKFIVF